MTFFLSLFHHRWIEVWWEGKWERRNWIMILDSRGHLSRRESKQWRKRRRGRKKRRERERKKGERESVWHWRGSKKWGWKKWRKKLQKQGNNESSARVQELFDELKNFSTSSRTTAFSFNFNPSLLTWRKKCHKVS